MAIPMCKAAIDGSDSFQAAGVATSQAVDQALRHRLQLLLRQDVGGADVVPELPAVRGECRGIGEQIRHVPGNHWDPDPMGLGWDNDIERNRNKGLGIV